MRKLPIATTIYGLIVKLRTLAFNKGWLKSTKFNIPVICVGNIAVGGTGKTPHILYIIELLNTTAPTKHIAVLSRGYKRKTKGFVLADHNSNAQTIGDEPMLIHTRYPNITVAVDEKRVHGIQQLLSLPQQPNLILLDDAFQHRYVQPSTSIVLVDYNHPPFNDTLLPAGRLREPMEALQRADIVIVTKTPTNLPPNAYNDWSNLLKLSTNQQPNKTQRLYFSSIEYPLHFDFETARTHKALLVTGIANPKPLAAYIRSQGIDFKQLTFPDHHNFTQSDIRRIENALQHVGPKSIILTTEKDAMRLVPMLAPAIQERCQILPITVDVKNIGEDIEFEELITTLCKTHT